MPICHFCIFFWQGVPLLLVGPLAHAPGGERCCIFFSSSAILQRCTTLASQSISAAMVLCRAGEDLKLLLTDVLYPFGSCWVMSFLLCTTEYLNITEMPGRSVFPFSFQHRKCPHFEESYKMSDWWNSWGRRQGFLFYSATQFLANWPSLLFITQTAETCIFPALFRPPLYYIPYHQWKDIDLVLRKYKKNYRKI